MKRNIYITAFTVLGILVQLVAHGVLETWYIGLLLQDFSRYGFGWTWQTWFMIHNIFTGVLLAAGALAGFSAGQHWWQEIYVKRRRFWRRR